jgi:hypothetical protein
MLARWEELFAQQVAKKTIPRTQDQATFRRALYESGLRLATMPTEYNCRFPYPASICGPVKILHGHGDAGYLARLAARVNAKGGFRVILQEHFQRSVILLATKRPAAPVTAAAPPPPAN